MMIGGSAGPGCSSDTWYNDRAGKAGGGGGGGAIATTATGLGGEGFAGGDGVGGDGGTCNPANFPCQSFLECCPGLACEDDGRGRRCRPPCGDFGAPCEGDGQGSCCSPSLACIDGLCLAAACDGSVQDCDGDGWLVADGDCCDLPGACGFEPEKVNPGALEVVGNGLDDNCNAKTDLFDTEDTLPCDEGLASAPLDPSDYARAIGICRRTEAFPRSPKQRTWGLLDARLLKADGSELEDPRAASIRAAFGAVFPPVLEGQRSLVLSSGIAADALQTDPGPNGGTEAGDVPSTEHVPRSAVAIDAPGLPYSVADWYGTASPPLKPAGGLPDAPGCDASDVPIAEDSVMLVLRLRAPTNARAFSFNSYFLSAEYPEFVCTEYNDQFIALVDTPDGEPSPIANPLDKNLLVYSDGRHAWPVGINIAVGTSLFSVCDTQQDNPACWSPAVSGKSCSLGSSQLDGTGFGWTALDFCTVGGGTFWLTTAGNVVPGGVLELRIALWDVGDSGYDSVALVDGFQWLADATLPGTN